MISALISVLLNCDCSPQPATLSETLKQAKDSAAIIFRGKVTSLSRNEDSVTELKWQKIEFEVLETFKGKLDKTVVVTLYLPYDGQGTLQQTKRCGGSYSHGPTEQLVYADADGKGFKVT